MKFYTCKSFICSCAILIVSVIFSVANANETDAVTLNNNNESYNWTPLQLGLTSRIQLINKSYNLHGLKLGFWTENKNVYGIALNVVGSRVADNFIGIQFSGIKHYIDGNDLGMSISGYRNSVQGNSTGIQLSLMNGIGGNLTGIQLGGCNFVRESSTGIQLGICDNGADEGFSGIQISLIGNMVGFPCIHNNFSGIQLVGWQNEVFGNSTGIQCGLKNIVWGKTTGIQLGVINYSEDMNGVQIGVYNRIIEGNKHWLPIINAKF